MTRVVNTCALALVTGFQSGCAPDPAAVQAPAPRFTIVRAYAGLEAFAAAAEKAPQDRARLFERHALAPFRAACGEAMGSFTALTADIDFSAARGIARAIDEARVPQLVEAALTRAADALPGAEGITVCLHAVSMNIALEHLQGVGGVSLGGVVKIFLHPTPHGFARVSYTAAHEYHHEAARRWLAPGWSADPSQSLIAEGKADVFATGLFPYLRPPHTDPLSAVEQRRTWSAFEAYRSQVRPAAGFRREFMFGLAADLPRWAGYRLAYAVVDEFVRRRSLTIAEWTRADAEAILAASAGRLP